MGGDAVEEGDAAEERDAGREDEDDEDFGTW
jgi:hypothetical protein